MIDSTIFTNLNVFRNELKRNPQIENFTTSSQIPGEWISNVDKIRAVEKDLKKALHVISIQSIMNFLKHMELNWLQAELSGKG